MGSTVLQNHDSAATPRQRRDPKTAPRPQDGAVTSIQQRDPKQSRDSKQSRDREGVDRRTDCQEHWWEYNQWHPVHVHESSATLVDKPPDSPPRLGKTLVGTPTVAPALRTPWHATLLTERSYDVMGTPTAAG